MMNFKVLDNAQTRSATRIVSVVAVALLVAIYFFGFSEFVKVIGAIAIVLGVAVYVLYLQTNIRAKM